MYKLQPFNINEEIIKLCCLISDYAVKHVLTFLCFITTHQQFIEKKKKICYHLCIIVKYIFKLH